MTDEFVDFTTISFWSYILDSITGCSAFLVWVRIFKYVSFNKVCKEFKKNQTCFKIKSMSVYSVSHFYGMQKYIIRQKIKMHMNIMSNK